MSKLIDISIDKGCQEQWNSFQKNKEGGFCGRCQKNVIDFTGKTDREIYQYLDKNRSGVCGRFNPAQLKTYTQEDNSNRFSKAAAVVAGILSVGTAQSQSTEIEKTTHIVQDHSLPSKENIHERSINQKSKQSTNRTRKTIAGKVTSVEDGSSLPSVNVVVKGTTNGTITDIDGNYSIKARDRSTLLFSFIGMATEEVEVGERARIDIQMSVEVTHLGEVCVVRKWSPRGVWYKIKRLF